MPQGTATSTVARRSIVVCLRFAMSTTFAIARNWRSRRSTNGDPPPGSAVHSLMEQPWKVIPIFNPFAWKCDVSVLAFFSLFFSAVGKMKNRQLPEASLLRLLIRHICLVLLSEFMRNNIFLGSGILGMLIVFQGNQLFFEIWCCEYRDYYSAEYFINIVSS